jgi:hypothetical protein
MKLLRDACGQSVDGLPLVVFIDANTPPTPGVPPAEKSWIRDMNAAAYELERRTDGAHADDPYIVIVATNFGMHFGAHDRDLAPREFGFIPARRPPASADEARALERIVQSVQTYTWVPAEV